MNIARQCRAYNKALQQMMLKNFVNALKVSEANTPEIDLQYLMDRREYSVPVYTPVSFSCEDLPAYWRNENQSKYNHVSAWIMRLYSASSVCVLRQFDWTLTKVSEEAM